jgi:group I intron endonuclease
MVIYKTTNLINGKIYIGQDSKNNPNYLGSGKILVVAIKKYGKKNFKKEILEKCETKEQLDLKEQYWIVKYNTLDKTIGYNITKGGGGTLGLKTNLGRIFSKEHKFKISENHADVSGEKNPMFGKSHKTSVKEAQRLRMSGTTASENTRKKMSEKRQGEQNINSKLTELQVIEIRKLYFEDDLKIFEIAKIYAVKPPCIHKIVNFLTWANI